MKETGHIDAKLWFFFFLSNKYVINSIRGTTDYSERSEVYNLVAREARTSRVTPTSIARQAWKAGCYKFIVNALLVFRQPIGLLYEQCLGHISIGTGWVFWAPVLRVYKCFLRLKIKTWAKIEVTKHIFCSHTSLYSVFTWRHCDHLGVPKQWNGGLVGVPNQSCGSLTLFLCKNVLLSQWISIDAGHMSENALYRIGSVGHLFFKCDKMRLSSGFYLKAHVTLFKNSFE